MAPTVSINLCCYNSEKYLEETLKSIFAQTYKDWELVIVNDGSTDSTENIIKKYIDKGYPIVYCWQENHGLGYSRNEALKRSRGKYIAFIDHDDIWFEEKLKKQIPLFENKPKVGLVYSDTIFFKNGKDLFNIYSRKKPYRGKVFSELLADYNLPLETVLIRKDALHYLDQWFDDTLIMAEEMDLFLRIAYTWELDYVNEPLAKWRIHKESESQKHPYLVPKETEIILEKLSRLYPDFKMKYSKEIELQKMKIAYNWALIKWGNGKILEARKHLRPYFLKGKKIFIIYVFTFFPYLLFRLLQKIYLYLK